MEKQLKNPTRVERPRRSPLAGRSKLHVRDQDPNYVYRIVNVNDERDPDRVQDFIDRGYEVVPSTKAGDVGDKQVDKPSALGSAGQISVGQGTKAIVMRIPRDWYLEDQAVKQRENDRVETEAQNRADYSKVEIATKRTIE
jgi:hypothetical protein